MATGGQVKKEKLYKDLPRPKLNRAQIGEIYAHLERLDPNPTTELNYSNPYTLVVAVALSAQSTDVGVNKATKALFAKADTPEKMVALGEDTVRDHIKTIGLYKNKAKNVIALSKMLLEDYGGVVPQKREDLIRLPGVGRKTANVVMNEAFGHPTMAVDTPLGAHHWLILHGRYTCVARKPKCYNCAVSDICKFRPKTKAP